jgi:hypothetical protein
MFNPHFQLLDGEGSVPKTVCGMAFYDLVAFAVHVVVRWFLYREASPEFDGNGDHGFLDVPDVVADDVSF